MKTIRRRATIKLLGELYGVKMKYRKLNGKNCSGYVIETNVNVLGHYIIKDDVRVLKWGNRFPYIKEVLKSYHAREMWIKSMIEESVKADN